MKWRLRDSIIVLVASAFVSYASNRNARTVTNWMMNVEFVPSMFAEPESIQELIHVVKHNVTYPSPLRAAGHILSPSNIHMNEDGTTLSLLKMNTIHGLEEMTNVINNVTCIVTDPGVTLRDLQLYAHSHGLELPFSAEIGSSTIGGTALATTKDSPIGKSPMEGMGMGDVSSMIYKMTIVEDDGRLNDYTIIDEETGEFNLDFQELLDSYGSRGIAVRLWVSCRPMTPLTTTFHLWPLHNDEYSATAEKLLNLRKEAAALDGNIFAILGWHTNIIAMEERIPVASENRLTLISSILTPVVTEAKRFCFQRCLIPSLLHLFRPLSGTFLLRHRQSSRSPGNAYPLTVRPGTRRLTFSYYAFDEDNFKYVVTQALEFTKRYEIDHGFAPNGFAVYFVNHSGHRLAGPYMGNERSVSFSFDPIYDAPLDDAWVDFVDAFNTFSKENGGIPALNQSLELDKNPEFGALAVYGKGKDRFMSPWLKMFFDSQETLFAKTH